MKLLFGIGAALAGMIAAFASVLVLEMLNFVIYLPPADIDINDQDWRNRGMPDLLSRRVGACRSQVI